METSPGTFNEAIFRGLDYALEQARQNGLKVLQQSSAAWPIPTPIRLMPSLPAPSFLCIRQQMRL